MICDALIYPCRDLNGNFTVRHQEPLTFQVQGYAAA